MGVLRPHKSIFASGPSPGLDGVRSTLSPQPQIMHPSNQGPRVFGPFDGDFDPFEDDIDAIPLERRPRRRARRAR